MDERDARPRARAIVWVEWGAVVLLLVGVAAYVIWKPLDPMADPRAAQALALVPTHPARTSTSVRQPIHAIVKANRKRNQTSVVRDSTVLHDDGYGNLVLDVVRRHGDAMGRWVWLD